MAARVLWLLLVAVFVVTAAAYNGEPIKLAVHSTETTNRLQLPPAGAKAYEEAQALHREKDYRGAMEAYGRVLDSDPNHVESLYLRANLLSMFGSPVPALPLYRRALKAAPAFLPIYVDYALTLSGMPERKYRAKSVRVLATLLERYEEDPDSLKLSRWGEARLLYCRGIENMGMHADALRCNRGLLKIYDTIPDPVDVRVATGRILERLGRVEEALEFYLRQCADREDPRCHAHAARCYNKMGRHADAVPHLRRLEAMERARKAPLADTVMPDMGRLEAMDGTDADLGVYPPRLAAVRLLHASAPLVAVADGFATAAEAAAVARVYERANAARTPDSAVCFDPYCPVYTAVRRLRLPEALHTRLETVPRLQVECLNASAGFDERAGLARHHSVVRVPPATEPVVDDLEARVEYVFGPPSECGDMAEVLRIEEGTAESPAATSCNLLYHENDVAVEALVVLEAPEEGGDLVFPSLPGEGGEPPLRVPMVAGRVVLVWSLDESWFCHPNAAYRWDTPARGRLTVLRKAYRRADMSDTARDTIVIAQRGVAGNRPYVGCDWDGCVESLAYVSEDGTAAAAAAAAQKRRHTEL